MSLSPRVRMVSSEPPEIVVYDEPGPCSYLPDQTWRLPLRLPVRLLTRQEFGMRLSQGDRRQGRLLYRTACPTCRACEPIRLEVARFRPNQSQRRTLARGNREIEVELGPLEVDDDRVRLYNVHKHERALGDDDHHANLEAYRSFLGESCCHSFEMRYRVGGELMGVAIVDRADDALSAVYFYWSPTYARLSPGSFSILQQIELCKRLDLEFLYLGLYIEACPSMSYKGCFLPHQRLLPGGWRRFDRAASADAEQYVSPRARRAD